MEEFAGLIVCAVAAFLLYCGSSLLPFLIPCIAFFMFVNMTNQYIRAPARAAQKATLQKAEKQRKQTPNPRFKKPSLPDSVPTTSGGNEEGAGDYAPPQRKHVDTAFKEGSTSPEMYSLFQREKKFDEYVFRKRYDGNDFPPSEQRRRVLDAMYKELVDTSLKADPFLRKADVSCRPLRGATSPHIIS